MTGYWLRSAGTSLFVEAHMVTTADPINLLLWLLVVVVIVGLIVFFIRRLF